MDRQIQHLNDFFNLYANRFNKALKGKEPDIEGTAGSFSDCFVSAGPAGISCGMNNEDFRNAIPQGYAFYRSIGVSSMDVLSVNTTILDSLHAMSRVKWATHFTRKDGTVGRIEFENIYFTRTTDNVSKIFAYITGDEQAALKANGLI